MAVAGDTGKPSIFETVDEFMAAVPWGESRVVLVYRRHHGGHTFIRLRTWNRHRELNVWYPSRRFFVILEDNASALADAIDAAACGLASEKPDWLVAREQAEAGLLQGLVGSEIPDDAVERSRMLARLRREQV